MDGLLKVIDMLGRTIAQLEQQIARDQEQIQALQETLAERSRAESKPTK